MKVEKTKDEAIKHWFDKPCPNTEHQPSRAKNWTLVVYPEDLPENWIEKIVDLKFPVAISPLHDRDINPDGEEKKPHHHVILKGMRTWINYSELAKLGKEMKGIAIPQKCSNVDGMVRYFVHADNPEKAQYNKSDIQTFGRFDLESAFRNTAEQDLNIAREIYEFIREQNITDFCDLMDMVLDNGLDDWYVFLNRSAWTIERYISSRRNKFKDMQKSAMK